MWSHTEKNANVKNTNQKKNPQPERDHINYGSEPRAAIRQSSLSDGIMIMMATGGGRGGRFLIPPTLRLVGLISDESSWPSKKELLADN